MKVGEILRKLNEDGWVLVATRGSHRQYRHPSKAGRVTVAGKPGDTGHRQIAALGVYESKLTRLVAKLAVEQGGMLLDVGANYGYYGLLWCGLNPANRSRAFEASPRVAARLRENIVLNGMADGIEVFEWAATNTEGSIPFDPGPPGPDRVGRHRERWRR